MFEVGFTEILLICAIALLVLGPARLPKLAADVGRWAGRARAMARQLRSQLEQEVNFDPLKDQPSAHRTSQTISPPPFQPAAAATATPAAATEPPAATTETPAAPDRNDEPKPA
jgi:sec-independent protein translocase protein TatB